MIYYNLHFRLSLYIKQMAYESYHAFSLLTLHCEEDFCKWPLIAMGITQSCSATNYSNSGFALQMIRYYKKALFSTGVKYTIYSELIV